MDRVVLGVLLALVSACEGKQVAQPQDTIAKPDTKAQPKPEARPEAEPEAKPEAKPEPQADAARGRVLEGPLPIAEMLGRKPTDVEAKLGTPLSKGMIRKSCVRFLPERTWFSCNFAMQRYADTTDAYTAVAVEYQDGIATAIAFEGLRKATGDYDPKAALAYVGLELPGEPKIETPEDGTTVAVWFNSAARLLIADRQYRVVVSTIGNDWARTKVEVILNDPLSEAEAARKIDKAAPDEPAP